MAKVIAGAILFLLTLVSCQIPTGDAPKSSAKAITTFGFSIPFAAGTVNESTHTISIVVPYGTNVTALVPTASNTGKSVSPPLSSAQDFSLPVTYTVTAEDGTVQSYLAQVSVSTIPAGSPAAGVTLVFHLEPIHFNSLASDTYSAYCQIKDSAGTTYNGATIKIAGTLVPYIQQYSFGSYHSNSSIGVLHTGDKVLLDFADPVLGSFSLYVVVPNSPGPISVSPALPQIGTANTATSYSVSWQNDGPGSIYMAGYQSLLSSASANGNGGASYPSSSDHYSFDATLIAPGGTPIPWLRFSLARDVKSGIYGFASQSEVELYGVTVQALTN